MEGCSLSFFLLLTLGFIRCPFLLNRYKKIVGIYSKCWCTVGKQPLRDVTSTRNYKKQKKGHYILIERTLEKDDNYTHASKTLKTSKIRSWFLEKIFRVLVRPPQGREEGGRQVHCKNIFLNKKRERREKRGREAGREGERGRQTDRMRIIPSLLKYTKIHTAK